MRPKALAGALNWPSTVRRSVKHAELDFGLRAPGAGRAHLHIGELVRHRAAHHADGPLVAPPDGERLSLPVVEERWHRHCSRLGLDLPVGALGA